MKFQPLYNFFTGVIIYDKIYTLLVMIILYAIVCVFHIVSKG